ncbi:MAG: aminotransferase class IV [Kiritimatiellae bacterium]|nr:aminotransferase class IV [Kiritimatiellia bacterium]
MSELPLLPVGQPPPIPPRPWHERYYAMYSSEWDAITTDARWMMVPVDDHVVHRGDGVFETMKCIAGGIYALREHVARLLHSARCVGLQPPWSNEEILCRILATVRAGRRPDCLIRVLLTRGPGGFGVAPTECPRPGLYIIAYRWTPSFMVSHPEGARATIVDVPLKPGWLATVKTCNYLPNVLMKMAASAAGADFPIALDETGCVAEGATENIGVVIRGELVLPPPGRILDGITMQRVLALAANAPCGSGLAGVRRAAIPKDELLAADEVLVFGTTPDVTSIVSIDGRPVGDGRPGPVRAALQQLLEHDQLSNPRMRTLVGLVGTEPASDAVP